MSHSATSIYGMTFLALLALLGLTVAAAMSDWGRWSPLVAMTIASAKTLLIVLFFMHLRDEVGLVRVFAAAGFLWLGLLLLFLACDYTTRADVAPALPSKTSLPISATGTTSRA
jgi:cytochrome c oxidase subunit 4